jgi:hypothetical protein
MNYKKGFSVKPKDTNNLGYVTFTDGTNDLMPNQLQCEAYGYTYDRATGTCKAFNNSTILQPNFDNESNLIKGQQNTTTTGTRNTLIMGESNIVNGYSRNNIIIGSNNEVASGVNNTTVLGSYGLAQRDGEIVIGGGAFEGAGAGYGQSSTMSLSGTTTDATQTNLFINNSSTNTIIARGSTSSFQGFEVNVIGVRTGGSAGAGAVNDRIYLNATGMVYLKDLQGGTARTQGAYGTTTGWTSVVAFSGTNDMHVSVTGVVDMNISWSATLHLYELKV